MKGIAFYEAVVQIIPILVLVVVVEYRMLGHEPRTWLGFVAGIVVGAIVLLAELSSLAVLKEEEDTAFTYVFAWAAIFLLMLLILRAGVGEFARRNE